jgi:hypothetical protein
MRVGNVPVPARIDPCQLEMLGGMVAVPLSQTSIRWMRQAAGLWEPGSRRWLVERRRIRPLVRNLRPRPIRCSGGPGSTWTGTARDKACYHP